MYPAADTAVIIGRFQVDDPHDGHHAFIRAILAEKYRRVVIILGISPFRSPNNPLDYPSREAMIKSRYPEVMVLPLRDCRTDEEWSENLDNLLRMTIPHGKTVLFGARDSFISRYTGKFSTVALEGGPQDSGTSHRARISRQVRPSADFRAGQIYAVMNDWDRVIPAVDIAIFKSEVPERERGKAWQDIPPYIPHLAVIRKAGEEYWRLPGGMVDPGDETYEAAARRELYEETLLTASEKLEYGGSYNVQDWRLDRSGAIFSSLYVGILAHQSFPPKAGDDAQAFHWLPIEKLSGSYVVSGSSVSVENVVVPEHEKMVMKAISLHLSTYKYPSLSGEAKTESK
jgi:bifunctional NMN adenylyltransferase/nudix hydrolase